MAERLRSGRGATAPDGRMIQAKIQASPRSLGLSEPPCRLELAVRPGEHEFRLVLWSDPEHMIQALTWLDQQGNFRLYEPTIADGSVAVIACSRVPKAWTWLEAPVRRPHLTLAPDEPATLSLQATEATLESLVDGMPGDDGRGRARWEPSQLPPSGLLTERQQEALDHASREGYYSIPRDIRLNELADKMDMSIGALSTLLRRAEARLVEAYMTALPSGNDGLGDLGGLMARPNVSAWQDLAEHLAAYHPRQAP